MAVPTITSVSPANGLPSGRGRVRVVGTNFRLPPALPATGPINAPWVAYVSVTFDGRNADSVVVTSSTEIWVITPEYRGSASDIPKAVDVVVTNLDDSLVAIPGETATATAAFTYKRQDLTEASDIEWVTRNLIRRMRRNVLANTAVATSLDYSDDPSTTLTAIGSIPAILLIGPDVSLDEENTETEDQTPIQSGNDTYLNLPAQATQLDFRLMAVASSKTEALNLLSSIILDLRKRPFLTVETSEGSGTDVELDLFANAESWESFDDFGNDVYSHETGLNVRGLMLDESYGVVTTGIPHKDVVAPESDNDQPTIVYQEGLV